MKLDRFAALSAAIGPFASVSLDATRTDATHSREIPLRWAALQRTLEDAGAPADVVTALSEAVLEPGTLPGAVGKLVVANADGVVLDLTLPEPPVRDVALWGPVPHLMPAVRAAAGRPSSYVLAQLDRVGADIDVVGMFGEPTEHHQTEGDHDVLHKIPGGGWSQLRYQKRVEDSWDHNAQEVAIDLDAVAARYRSELVLVGGDPKALAALQGHLPARLRDQVVQIGTGGRAAGTSDEAVAEAVAAEIEQHLRAQRARLIERFGQEWGTQQAATQGLDGVVAALRRGQVDQVLLHDDPTSTLMLWIGDAAGQVGLTRDEVVAMGCEQPAQARADAVILWTLMATDAGISLLPDDELSLRDGIGALLRWSDAATPHDTVPSMPGHGERSGA